MNELVVLGGGEHARVVIEAATSAGWRVRGIVDPQPCAETCARLRVGHLGGDDAGLALVRERDLHYVLGLGSLGPSPLRAQVVARYDAAGARWAAIIHVAARVSPTARVGEGAVVFAGAVLNTGSSIGRHGVVNTGAIIEHDVEVGEQAQVGPGAVLGGGVKVGAGSYLGLGCRVRDHVTVGSGALVGMGAVVVDDVPAGARVLGVPAKVVRR